MESNLRNKAIKALRTLAPSFMATNSNCDSLSIIKDENNLNEYFFEICVYDLDKELKLLRKTLNENNMGKLVKEEGSYYFDLTKKNRLREFI